MHTGRRYRISEVMLWTRRRALILLVHSFVPVVLYAWLGWKWLAIPWPVVAMLGTATAFIVGFKNTQSYNRAWEARQIWGSIMNASRAWAAMTKGYLPHDPELVRDLVRRHLAWVAALRYQLREPRAWESMVEPQNQEYRERWFEVPEMVTPVEVELAKFLGEEELAGVLKTKNRATQIMGLQSSLVGRLAETGKLDAVRHVALQEAITSHYDAQGRAERIKNTPYPRQFATANGMFVKLFATLLPFGLLKEFSTLAPNNPYCVWLVVPFSVIVSWIVTTLEQVGDSTENPFEGGPNDVPMAQLQRAMEIDMLEMIGETELPPAIRPTHDILL